MVGVPFLSGPNSCREAAQTKKESPGVVRLSLGGEAARFVCVAWCEVDLVTHVGADGALRQEQVTRTYVGGRVVEKRRAV
jgi:hypothetical protein